MKNFSANHLEGQCMKSLLFERFEVFTAVTIKKAIFWDVMPCGSCKNRHFRGTYRLHHQVGKNQKTRKISSNSQMKHTVKNH
jgi:hypothetical protein